MDRGIALGMVPAAAYGLTRVLVASGAAVMAIALATVASRSVRDLRRAPAAA